MKIFTIAFLFYGLQCQEIFDPTFLGWISDQNGELFPVNRSTLFDDLTVARVRDFNEYFYLFTRRNLLWGQKIITGDVDSLQRSNFNPAHPTRIVVDGYFSQIVNTLDIDLRVKYLGRGDYNVIIMNWTDGAVDINYIEAAVRAKVAANKLAAWMKFMRRYGGLNPNTTYLIGHSLGAHIVGLVGKQITSPKINTIFALDPANSPYEAAPPEDRVYITDAQYVEAIYSDYGILAEARSSGHASFYGGFGSFQPGCPHLTTLTVCDHARSFEYFVYSLGLVNHFFAIQCANHDLPIRRFCEPTGEYAYLGGEPSNFNRGVSGIYYLPVGYKKPYSLGQYFGL